MPATPGRRICPGWGPHTDPRDLGPAAGFLDSHGICEDCNAYMNREVERIPDPIESTD